MYGDFLQAPASTAADEDSRYGQLCDALSNSRAARASQREECFSFVERFVQGLIGYLEIPPDLVRLALPDGSLDEAPLTVSGASTLVEDGFWQTGLNLTIRGRAGRSPSAVVTLVLHVKKGDGVFAFKLFPDGPLLRIDDAPDADLSPAYDLVFQQLLTWLQSPG
jgi:hypothetical protein